MKDSTMWVTGWLIAAATLVGVSSVIAWSVNNTSTLHNEKVIACVDNGGTWIDYQSMCLNRADSVK